MHQPGSEPVPAAQRPLSKAEWRARLLAARAEVPIGVRAVDADALARTAARMVAELEASTVCGYLPFGAEPGSLRLVTELAGTGTRVLLPVIPANRGPLEWAAYHDENSLVSGPLPGLLEPSGERLPPTEIAKAELVLVPALAVDTDGVRLGRGAGYYDRTLPLAAPGARLVAVVRDEEVVPRLPAEPHDVRMTGVMTPSAGLRELPL